MQLLNKLMDDSCPLLYFHHHVLSQKAIRKYNSFLNTQPLNFMHWTFPDFMSLASLFCIKSQVVKFCIFNLLPTFCKNWTLAFIPRQHSLRNFKLNLQHARLVWSNCCWMYILCIEKSFYFPPKKYTYNMTNLIENFC